MTYDEIVQNATENDWTAEQLEDALREAGISAGDLPDAEELDLSAMSKVSGGSDEAVCPHNGEWTIKKRFRDISTRFNDGGIHYLKQKLYICPLCGKEFWEDERPR